MLERDDVGRACFHSEASVELLLRLGRQACVGGWRLVFECETEAGGARQACRRAAGLSTLEEVASYWQPVCERWTVVGSWPLKRAYLRECGILGDMMWQ